MTTQDNSDLLSADSSPGELNEKVGVRRVNNRPLYILGFGLCIFLVIIAMVAYDRSAKSQKVAAPQQAEGKKTTMTTASFAKAAIGDQEAGIVPPADPYATLTPPPDLAEASEDAAPAGGLKPPAAQPGGVQPVPPIRPMDSDPQLRRPGKRTQGQGPNGGANDLSAPLEPPKPDREMERLQELKFKLFEKAVAPGSAVAFNPRQKPAAAGAGAAVAFAGGARDADPRLAEIQAEIARVEGETESAKSYQERLAEMRGKMPSQGGEPMAAAPAASRNDLAKFDGDANRWKLNTRDEAPATYQLTTGHIIPTILLTGINSELPGPIVAQVSRDVYDTATGKHLLIPQGTKVYGGYSSDIVYGQASLMVAAQRLVYPDGKTRDLGSMPAADAAGNTGMRDKVNNHYVRIFGSSFLMSGITAGVALSQPAQNGVSQQPTARSALSEALGQQLGQTATQMLSKNLNIAPTLEIRPGYRFNIIVVKDLTFQTPYKAFDYARRK